MLKILTLILMMVSLVLPVWAADPLAWQDCVGLAAENNQVLASALQKVKQAEASTDIARADLLPQVNANAGDVISKTYSADKEGNSTKGLSYGVSGSWLLFDGFKNARDLSAAKFTWKAAEYDYMVTSSDVRLSLRSAFVDLLRAQQLVDLVKEIAERRKANLEMVTLRYEAGLEHKGSLLTAQANSLKADSDVVAADRALMLAKVSLNKELGRASMDDVAVKGSMDIDNTERMSPDFLRLVQVSPLLQELMARKEAARQGVKSSRADRYPKIYATASGGRSGHDLPIGKSGESWSYGLSVSFPIFTGGSKAAAVKKASAALEQAQADENSGRDGAFLTLVNAWVSFQNALDQVETDKKFLEAAQEMANVSRAQYDLGMVTFNDWTLIEDNLVTTTKNYLASRAGALTAEAVWVQARGGLLNDKS